MKLLRTHLRWLILWYLLLTGCFSPPGILTLAALISGALLWRATLWQDCSLCQSSGLGKFVFLGHLRASLKWLLVCVALSLMVAFDEFMSGYQKGMRIGQTAVCFAIPLLTGIDIPFRVSRQHAAASRPTSSPTPWNPIYFAVIGIFAVVFSMAIDEFAPPSIRAKIHGNLYARDPNLGESTHGKKPNIPSQLRSAGHFAYVYLTAHPDGLVCIFASKYPGIAEQNAQVFIKLMSNSKSRVDTYFVRSTPYDSNQSAEDLVASRFVAYIYKEAEDNGLICTCVGRTVDEAMQIAYEFSELHRLMHGRSLIVSKVSLGTE